MHVGNNQNIKLGTGIVSREGFSVIDDSRSMALTNIYIRQMKSWHFSVPFSYLSQNFYTLTLYHKSSHNSILKSQKEKSLDMIAFVLLSLAKPIITMRSISSLITCRKAIITEKALVFASAFFGAGNRTS